MGNTQHPITFHNKYVFQVLVDRCKDESKLTEEDKNRVADEPIVNAYQSMILDGKKEIVFVHSCKELYTELCNCSKEKNHKSYSVTTPTAYYAAFGILYGSIAALGGIILKTVLKVS